MDSHGGGGQVGYWTLKSRCLLGMKEVQLCHFRSHQPAQKQDSLFLDPEMRQRQPFQMNNRVGVSWQSQVIEALLSMIGSCGLDLAVLNQGFSMQDSDWEQGLAALLFGACASGAKGTRKGTVTSGFFNVRTPSGIEIKWVHYEGLEIITSRLPRCPGLLLSRTEPEQPPFGPWNLWSRASESRFAFDISTL